MNRHSLTTVTNILVIRLGCFWPLRSSYSFVMGLLQDGIILIGERVWTQKKGVKQHKAHRLSVT